ncbi:27168_t:CDS:2 [Gigaspora margarita]|uniref:Dynein light chain roadblock n=2 Tax=Gigaspora margarita TaxID=4874 RepID=A0A8H4ARR6_GIGMA|nr:roadblock-type dynein light chain [Gigaspora margarita]CAG8464846.1 27168_t:CDS:2 [Gigaspora margarita]
MSNTEVEDTIKRLSANKYVQAVLIVNKEGQTIKSTLDESLSKKYSDLITKLVDQTIHVIREMDDEENKTNDLSFLRVRTKKHEILVAPDTDYLLIVIQDPEKS